jgi:uncharacterized membrane protein YgcG
MVLVEGENADGVTVDEEGFDVNTADAPTVRAADQVVSAILGTQEGAAESGYQLRSTGVTWTDPVEAARLRDALAARKVENVMLVSSFLAAAALAQVVGNSVGYEQTGLLFIEPDTATLAVVNTADGSITDVHRQPLPPGRDPVAELTAMASGAQTLPTRPDGLFVVGSGVDIAPIKARLEAATGLTVNAPEEPETALARGAALASANAPLFSSSTAALAYAQDPGTGAVDPCRVAPGYFDVPEGAEAGGERALAYSAVPDDEADAYTAVADEPAPARTGVYRAVVRKQRRRPFMLVGSAITAVFVVGVVALVITLAMTIGPSVGLRPTPGHHAVAPSPAPAAPARAPNASPPAAPAPAPPPNASPPAAPPPAAPAPAPAPAAPPPSPAPAPAAPAPAPVAPAPAPGAPAPAPVVPVPAPVAPAPAPVAPAPAPVAPAPAAPHIPQIFSPPAQGPPMQPWGGDHGGGGWGHGGGPPGGGIPGGGGPPGGGGGPHVGIGIPGFHIGF